MHESATSPYKQGTMCDGRAGRICHLVTVGYNCNALVTRSSDEIQLELRL